VRIEAQDRARRSALCRVVTRCNNDLEQRRTSSDTHGLTKRTLPWRYFLGAPPWDAQVAEIWGQDPSDPARLLAAYIFINNGGRIPSA
jgi:hypothetical protein